MERTFTRAINRGNNLLAIGFLAIVATGLIGDLLHESELSGKADELAMLAVGAGAIIWYQWRDNRHSRSFAPLTMLVAALVIKGVGLALEIHDAEDIQDDIGVVLFLLVAIGAVGTILFRTRATPAAALERPI